MQKELVQYNMSILSKITWKKNDSLHPILGHRNTNFTRWSVFNKTSNYRNARFQMENKESDFFSWWLIQIVT